MAMQAHFWVFFGGCWISFALFGFVQKANQGESYPSCIKWGLKFSTMMMAIVALNCALTMIPH